MRSIVFLLATWCLAGCSHRAVYENLQITQREHCARGPASQYEECLQRSRQTYDEYERERRRVPGAGTAPA